MKTYTSNQNGCRGFAREAIQLYRRSRQSSEDIQSEIERVLALNHSSAQLVETQTCVKLENLDVLEIGAGQLPRQGAYFALNNRVTGIDLDVVPSGWDVRGYLRLLRRNGPKRLVKTIGRRLFRFDAQIRDELCRQLQVRSLPHMKLIAMDATQMAFPDSSFDFVYSFDVFEHLPDPCAVLDEIMRILRPGGCMLIYLHLWTCDSGHHDLRISLPEHGKIEYWAHLRPAHAATVQTYAYLNMLRLDQWRALFIERMPDAKFTPWRLDTEAATALETLRKTGDLQNFTDEELLTDRLLVVWRKPAPKANGPELKSSSMAEAEHGSR